MPVTNRALAAALSLPTPPASSGSGSGSGAAGGAAAAAVPVESSVQGKPSPYLSNVNSMGEQDDDDDDSDSDSDEDDGIIKLGRSHTRPTNVLNSRAQATVASADKAIQRVNSALAAQEAAGGAGGGSSSHNGSFSYSNTAYAALASVANVGKVSEDLANALLRKTSIRERRRVEVTFDDYNRIVSIAISMA
jgi:hypothetical protein